VSDSERPDNLDDLLAKARWPEPTAGASRRVEEVWESITPARRAGTIHPWRWAAAACVVLAGITALVMSRSRHSQPVQIVKNDPAPLTAVDVRPAYPSRPPNPWELAAIRETMKPKVVKAPLPAPIAVVPQPPPTMRQKLAQYLSNGEVEVYLSYVRNPATRSVALAAADDVAHPPLQSLLAALDDPHESIRIAAARTLGHIDGPVTTAALIQRINDRSSRREALAALLFSDGPEANRFVRSAQNDPHLGAEVRSLQLQRSTLQ
jgi:hypothetical protein